MYKKTRWRVGLERSPRTRQACARASALYINPQASHCDSGQDHPPAAPAACTSRCAVGMINADACPLPAMCRTVSEL